MGIAPHGAVAHYLLRNVYGYRLIGDFSLGELMEHDRRTHETREEAKTLICELVAAAGGTMRGKVRLHKSFHFAHLFYWRDAGAVLTAYPIIRAPLGPVMDDGDGLLAELVDEDRISIDSEPVGPYRQSVYHLGDDGIRVDLGSPRWKAITQAVVFTASMSASELSELTHEYSRSWQETPDGREMDIYADLISDGELDEIRTEIRAVRGA